MLVKLLFFDCRGNPAVLVGVGLCGANVLRRVYENLLNILVVVGRNGFVTRTEVEYLAASSLVNASAAEYFAACEPADEEKLVRCGYSEVFAVGFFVLENYLFVDAFSDGMTLLYNPKDFLVAGFTPLEVAGRCSAKSLESL